LSKRHHHEEHKFGCHFGIDSSCNHGLKGGYGNQSKTGHQLCIEGSIESSIGFLYHPAKYGLKICWLKVIQNSLDDVLVEAYHPTKLLTEPGIANPHFTQFPQLDAQKLEVESRLHERGNAAHVHH